MTLHNRPHCEDGWLITDSANIFRWVINSSSSRAELGCFKFNWDSMPTEDQCELPSSLSHTLDLMNPSGFIPWCHIFILFSNSPQVCFHFRCPKYILLFNILHSWKSSRILVIGSTLLSWGKTAEVSLIVRPQHGQSMHKKQFPSTLFTEYAQRSLKPHKYFFPLFVYSMWTFLQTCLNLIDYTGLK